MERSESESENEQVEVEESQKKRARHEPQLPATVRLVYKPLELDPELSPEPASSLQQPAGAQERVSNQGKRSLLPLRRIAGDCVPLDWSIVKDLREKFTLPKRAPRTRPEELLEQRGPDLALKLLAYNKDDLLAFFDRACANDRPPHGVMNHFFTWKREDTT